MRVGRRTRWDSVGLSGCWGYVVEDTPIKWPLSIELTRNAHTENKSGSEDVLATAETEASTVKCGFGCDWSLGDSEQGLGPKG